MRPQFSKTDYLDFVAKLRILEKQFEKLQLQRKRLDNEELILTKKIMKFKNLIQGCREQFR
jgi:hypothetical protein